MAAGRLVETDYPDHWTDLHGSFAAIGSRAEAEQLAAQNALIFEDVIPEGLGTGYFYNTHSSVSQLVVALAVAPNPAVKALVRGHEQASGLRRLVQELRDEQVLEGLKVLDLGCGGLPGFAIAASALGAEVHTVDGESLDVRYAKWVVTHTAIDLTAPVAIPTIAKHSGGAFDYVTENIIDTVQGHPSWVVPDEATIRPFGEQLLKLGGYLYRTDSGLLQKAGEA